MKLNLLEFTPVTQSVKVNAYTEKEKEQYAVSIFKNEFSAILNLSHELPDIDRLVFSFDEKISYSGEKYEIEIDLHKNTRIAKHYYNHLLYNYFKENADVVGTDFVDNVEVWVKSSNQTNYNLKTYLRFSVIPQYKKITDGWELIISYNGISNIHINPISTLNLQTTRYRVIAQKEVVKFKHLTPEHKQDLNNIFPVINREVLTEIGLKESRPLRENKYIKTSNLINDFAKKYLFVDSFKNTIELNSDDFYSFDNPPENKVLDKSNQLLFGNNIEGYDVNKGITDGGPFSPPKKNDIEFFFIAHEKDKPTCMTLFNIFTFGVSSPRNLIVNTNDDEKTKQFKEAEQKKKVYSKTLWEYIRQPFKTTKNTSIFFTNNNTAIEEVTNQLTNNGNRRKDCMYVAIYISPVSKDNVNSPHHNIYYQLKEILLEKNITSQVIYNENPGEIKSFKYHVPNIAVALLAKIGGIPWQLKQIQYKKELIIGVGAFKSEKVGKKYIGSAFSFNKYGIFQNLECHRDDDLENLTANIKKAIGRYVVDNDDKKLDRIIIHYYKTMSKREAKPITDMLYNLGYNIPVIVVTINKTEASDIVAFDTDFQDLMPKSGTFIKVGYNQFLLYNNSKYQNSTKYDILFPVKIKLAKVKAVSNPDKDVLSMGEVKEMLDQVYQLSRMYWKSVKQQNLPITIKYPEMVAEIVPHFSDAEMPQFGKTNLWFL